MLIITILIDHQCSLGVTVSNIMWNFYVFNILFVCVRCIEKVRQEVLIVQINKKDKPLGKIQQNKS